LIRSVVSFSCKESSVKNIIQGECTLWFRLSARLHWQSQTLLVFFHHRRHHWSRGSTGRCEHCLRIRVIVCL
jgi:hypothetical protein